MEKNSDKRFHFKEDLNLVWNKWLLKIMVYDDNFLKQRVQNQDLQSCMIKQQKKKKRHCSIQKKKVT